MGEKVTEEGREIWGRWERPGMRTRYINKIKKGVV